MAATRLEIAAPSNVSDPSAADEDLVAAPRSAATPRPKEKPMKRTATLLWLLTALLAAAPSAQAQIKLGYIDPLSGLMAATGDHGLRELRFAVERINARGGILGQQLEIVAMDNKLSPQESLRLLGRAID